MWPPSLHLDILPERDVACSEKCGFPSHGAGLTGLSWEQYKLFCFLDKTLKSQRGPGDQASGGLT